MNKSKLHKEKPSVLKDDVAALSREKLVAAREEAVHMREDAESLREDAVDIREDSILLREKKAALREREIHAAEAIQVAIDEHIKKLQQANANLVVATMKARKLTDEVESTNTQMERAMVIAEKANLAKSVLVSTMSHELRTPLSAILGFAQLLEIGSPPPTDIQTERLHQIINAGWYLLELINGVLDDHATIESGERPLILSPVPLETTMIECLAMIESQAQKRDIHINFIPFDKTWFVNAERIRVKQVLINLLTNAIKYNREHGAVEVKCTCTQERIRISIKDSGVGLPPEKMAQLFQPFNRLGQEFGVEEGTGIGLVITKQLIELMGGSINVESTVGVGSVFSVELNRAEGSATCL